MNDIDLYNSGGGELQPYSPSQPLAPAPDIGNTQLSNREIDEYTRYSGGGQAVFGVALPAGVSVEQVRQGFTTLGNVFVADFMQLGHNVSQTQACVSWFMDAIVNPPAKQQKRHSYNLYEHSNDATFQAFANFAHDHGFSPKLISDACWWVTTAAKKLGSSQGKPTAKEGNPNSTDPTANLTDAQFKELVDHNNRVQAQTMAVLQDRWGSCFKINIELAQAQLNKQTPAELAHLDRYTGNWPWTHMFNTVELLTAMYEMAVGAASIGTNGAEIAKEIAQFEAMLKIPSERAKYMKDSQLQARLRELYQRRGG
ncbi:hypothetical protein [Pseudomonas fluorescens]|uniref:Uncharacterized protein n=1 Tax=Pseudomonas fluorescens TaxID=294 RepID=A0A5E7U186_PSEFL|nr:hypothetical protein [Pseudomonas fluorescens]VVQ05093.1 hypothetical protein PS928_02966 [Pseudomonas fluorescens]